MAGWFPITSGWNAINVSDSAYLVRVIYWSAQTSGGYGCTPAGSNYGCGYLAAWEFSPGSSLANFVGVNAPKVGDFINTYDYTTTSGNINGRRCIEILDIIEEQTYNTGNVTCPSTFVGHAGIVYGYTPWAGVAPCPCTVPAIVPQGITVGSHWNSPVQLQPVYAQQPPIPLSLRFTDCQTCIQTPPTQQCGCTDPTATNYVNQYGSHALQPCCTLCDGTDDNDCCTYTMMGCQDNNAWNFCHTCTMDCIGTTYPVVIPPWSNSNVDTSCCRYECPPNRYDCCTYATCPETFQLHYGQAWQSANPGLPTPSVNSNSKFCQERFDGTGQYSTLQACKNNCNKPGPVFDVPKGYDDIKGNRQNPNCPDGWEHLMPNGDYMCGKTHPGGRSIRDMVRSNFNL